MKDAGYVIENGKPLCPGVVCKCDSEGLCPLHGTTAEGRAKMKRLKDGTRVYINNPAFEECGYQGTLEIGEGDTFTVFFGDGTGLGVGDTDVCPVEPGSLFDTEDKILRALADGKAINLRRVAERVNISDYDAGVALTGLRRKRLVSAIAGKKELRHKLTKAGLERAERSIPRVLS